MSATSGTRIINKSRRNSALYYR